MRTVSTNISLWANFSWSSLETDLLTLFGLLIWLNGDIPDAGRILGQLLNDAQPGFPIPDFPMCVQKAHNFAHVNGLELSVLQDILFEGITQNLTPLEKEKILRMKHLGENLTNRRYKNA